MSLSAALATAADLTVEVRNVRPRRGEVKAALFDDQRSFAAAVRIRAVLRNGEISSGVFTREEDFQGAPAATVVVPAQARSVTLRFTNLEPGEYALGVYQDLNRDDKLDITLGGLSLEPWTVSNDAVDLDADPKWETAKFVLPPGGLGMVVNLRDERQEQQPGDPR